MTMASDVMPGKSPCCDALWWVKQMAGMRLLKKVGKVACADVICSECNQSYTVDITYGLPYPRPDKHKHEGRTQWCAKCKTKVCAHCVQLVEKFEVRSPKGGVIQSVLWYHDKCTGETDV